MTPSIPKTIYHYCSIESFFNVIKNKELYLSNASFMNDSSESKWIISIINKIIAEKHNKLPWLFLSFITDVRNIISRYLQGNYIACFSHHQDMLSQWRGYANDGSGVAIGFNSKILKSIHFSNHSTHNLAFSQVIYHEEDQEKLIDNVFNHFYQLSLEKEDDPSQENIAPDDIDSFKNIKVVWPPERVSINHVLTGKVDYKNKKNYFINKCAGELLILSLFFKNNAFLEESEYRICFFPNFTFLLDATFAISPLSISEQNFRISNNKIVPYHSLNFSNSNNFINEVTLGPKCQTDEKILRSFLKKYGIEDIKIKKSKASYR